MDRAEVVLVRLIPGFDLLLSYTLALNAILGLGNAHEDELANKTAWVQKHGGVGHIRNLKGQTAPVLWMYPRRGLNDNKGACYRRLRQNLTGDVRWKLDELKGCSQDGLVCGDD